jgi:hypothetical protein
MKHKTDKLLYQQYIMLITFRAHSSTPFHGMFSILLSATNCERKDEQNETIDIFGKRQSKKYLNPMIVLDLVVEKVLKLTL